MVLAFVAVTTTITPVVTSIHRPSDHLIGCKCRTLQTSKLDAELRMLACFHSQRHVSSLLSLLLLSHPTKRVPIFLHALHLIELTGRASTLLITATSPTSSSSLAPISSHSPTPFITIHPLSVAFAFPDMHLDVYIITEEKHAAFILLPFHKLLIVYGDLEPASNPGLCTLNMNILSSGPCSVGLFVDRGFTYLSLSSSSSHRVVVLFIGGAHEREVLTFACRMVDKPSTSISLLSFIPLVGFERGGCRNGRRMVCPHWRVG